MKILFIGDVIGQSGRKIVQAMLPELRRENDIDLVVANVENLAGGFGVTRETLSELKKAGVDVFSSGNHIWDKKEVSITVYEVELRLDKKKPILGKKLEVVEKNKK